MTARPARRWIVVGATLGMVEVAAAASPRDYPVKPVPFTAVHLKDAFWLPRIETNRTVSIPFAFEKCEETKRMYHFERAAAALRGEELKDKTPPGYPFDDTDLYKVIEGAAYTLSVTKDPKLEAYLDGLITKIAAAQEKDGYLYTTRTIDPEHPHRWAGTKRWELEKVDSHELYNLGHLYEAAVAHYQATGKRTLLDVALRTADLLDRTFGPGKESIWPGHQITEMGLVKLYRVTAFGQLKDAGAQDLVLDMRYNGGGLVSVAQRLGGLIGGAATANRAFVSFVHNDKQSQRNTTLNFPQPPNALDLSRLVVIATRSSASASELIVSGLRPYMTVTVVGDRTFGKPVGQYSFDFCDKVLHPVAFSTRNARNEGDYFDGIAADCPAPDDLGRALGDAGEGSLAEALQHMRTGRCSGTAAAQLRAQSLRRPPDELQPHFRDGWRQLLGSY